MPRLIVPIYSDVYWKPLTEDVEELLSRFQYADTVRYEVFSAIWREMGFSEVFRGITLSTEMKRFCRVTFNTALKYFLPPYTYQIQVGGLYLMYAFYHTQLAIPRVTIRVALKDLPHFQRFLRASVSAQHYDVVYVFRKLVVAKALHFTAMPHVLTFRKQRNTGGRVPECQSLFLGRSMRVAELVSPEMLEELANVQGNYERLRAVVAGSAGCLPGAVQPDLPGRLHDCARSFVAWQELTFHLPVPRCRGDRPPERKPPPEPEADSSARAQLLSAIKGRSYGSYQPLARARRHRRGEAAAEESGEASPGEPRRGRSLRARTERSLRVREATTNVQCWLLSAPEQDRLSLKRSVLAARSGMEEE